MEFQQTVAAPLEISGQALHSGSTVTMRISPQPTGTGIYFSRSDLPGQPRLKADVTAVVDTKKSVTLGKDGWRIATIEHLMAVFHGLGIDNALVEVDGAELPLGDGSALFFAQRITEVGLIVQDQPREYLKVQEPLWVSGSVLKQGQPSKATLVILPSDRLEISFTFSSDHQATGTQFLHYTLDASTFIREIAPARTIAFVKEIEYLRSQGLALSDAYDCAVIVGENGYQNELHFPDEIVRHKILDILGDLYLVGPLLGHLVAVRSGHALDLELARKISARSIQPVLS